MKKVKRVLVVLIALIFAILGLCDIAVGTHVVVTETGINPRIIDSEVDKFFFLLMIYGSGIAYVMISVCFLKNWNPIKYKPVLYTGLAAMAAFIVGIYYHIVFGSPW